MDKFAEIFDKQLTTLTEAIASLGPDATRIYQEMICATSVQHWCYFVLNFVVLFGMPFLMYKVYQSYKVRTEEYNETENNRSWHKNISDLIEGDVWPIFLFVFGTAGIIATLFNISDNLTIALYPEQYIIKTFLK